MLCYAFFSNTVLSLQYIRNIKYQDFGYHFPSESKKQLQAKYSNINNKVPVPLQYILLTTCGTLLKIWKKRGKGSGSLKNMWSGSFKLTKDTCALYCSVRYGTVLSSLPVLRIRIGIDPHLFGCPGSESAFPMRIRIQGHGNWPKFKNKPGFLPFK